MTDIIYFICELITPILMLITGLWLRFNPPEFGSVGYHTQMTLKSKDAWDMAQVVCGKNLLVLGPPTLVLSIAAGTAGLIIKPGEDPGALFMVGVVVLQSFVFITAIIMTEHTLRKFFNSDGTPRT